MGSLDKVSRLPKTTPQQGIIMSKFRNLSLLLIVIASISCGRNQNETIFPTPTVSQTELVPTKIPGQVIEIPFLSEKILEEDDFPVEEINYPSDWPETLEFPDEFKLVDANTTSILEDENPSLTGKIRHLNPPNVVNQSLLSFLNSHDWKVVRNESVDSGAYFLMVEKEGGSGMFVIDSEPNGNGSLIIFTVSH